MFAAIAANAPTIGDRHSETAAAQPPGNRPSPRTQAPRSASVQWERVPLRDAVARVSKLFGEPVFVDRRVDPNLRITLQLEAASIDEVLRAITDVQSLGMSRLGALRYLGPSQSAEQLRTVAAVRSEEIAQLNRPDRLELERKQRLTWARLSEPRDLVVLLAKQRGWRVTKEERIPHDLWAAGTLPELSAADQMTILLIGFDLSFKTQLRDGLLEIVPMEQVTVRREYPMPSRSKEYNLVRQELGATKSMRFEGRNLVVDARVEQHERLAEILAGRAGPRLPRRPRLETSQRYTLRVQEQPVGAVLRQLAERMDWTVEFDEASIRAAGLSLEARVSFSVENANQDELLDAVLAPAELDFRREGVRLRIVPRSVRK